LPRLCRKPARKQRGWPRQRLHSGYQRPPKPRCVSASRVKPISCCPSRRVPCCPPCARCPRQQPLPLMPTQRKVTGPTPLQPWRSLVWQRSVRPTVQPSSHWRCQPRRRDALRSSAWGGRLAQIDIFLIAASAYQTCARGRKSLQRTSATSDHGRRRPGAQRAGCSVRFGHIQHQPAQVQPIDAG